jgi:hypothetical protein
MGIGCRMTATAGVVAAVAAALVLSGQAGADPVPNQDSVADYDQPQLLPVVTPVPNDWQPQFPLHYDDLRRYVTDADINAERDMCQWFNAQYDTLRHQIEGLNDALIRTNGHWDADGAQAQADIVTANIDQSEGFLAPRAQALTQSYDNAGDMYFPLYQGDSFYGLWQQMSNVNNGIRAHQPTWFTGPSFQRMLHWGSKINRSHVCR